MDTGRVDDDERLMSLVEQTEALVRAWADSQAISPVGEVCPATEILRNYAAGTMSSAQALDVAGHLGDCARCRGAARTWRLLHDAEEGGGTCDLGALRAIHRSDPDLAARALVCVSRRVAKMLVPVPPERAAPAPLDIPVSGERGDCLGDELQIVLERQPRIDSRYRLRFQIRLLETPEGLCRLRVLLKDERGNVDVGTVALAEAVTAVAIDLSDLCVEPGYLRTETIQIVAERVVQSATPVQEALGETGPLAGSVLPDPATDAIGRTLTPQQLASLPDAGTGQIVTENASEAPVERQTGPRKPHPRRAE